MPLNTRAKRRAAVNSSVEFTVNGNAEKSVKINVSSACGGEEGTKNVKSVLLDISVIGCAIESPYIVPPGVLVHIKIDPKPFAEALSKEIKEPMSISGTVKSCVMKAACRYRIGVQFVNPDKKVIDIVENFIKLKERRKAPRWGMGT